MKEAFNFMFKDNLFKKKVFVYFIYITLANLFINYSNIFAPSCKGCIAPIQYYILYFIGSIILLIPNGYGITCIKAFIEQNDNYILPFLNPKNNFILGLKLTINALILTAVMGIIILIAGLLLGFIGTQIALIILPILLISSVIILSFYLPAFSYIFATTESYLSFINFKKATFLIKNDLKHYFLSCLTFFAITVTVGFISSVITFFAGVNVFLIAIISVISALISCYTIYVLNYIVAKSIKESI